MKTEKLIKKGDILIILFFLLVAVFLFVLPLLKRNSSLTADIYEDGKLVRSIDISDSAEEEEIEIRGCIIKVSDGHICFAESDCRDKICVNTGDLYRAGDSAICLPNHVAVIVRSGENDKTGMNGGDVDAVTY